MTAVLTSTTGTAQPSTPARSAPEASPSDDGAEAPKAPPRADKAERSTRSGSGRGGRRPTRPRPTHPQPRRPQTAPPARPTASRAAGTVNPPRTARNAEATARWDPLRFRPASVAAEDHTQTRRSHVVSRIDPLPDPTRAARAIVGAVCQVLAGRRPVDHLARWTSLELFQALVRRVGLAHRIMGVHPVPTPAVVSVRAELTLSGACEAAAVLDDGGRVRGAAMRLELRQGRWQLTALEIG